VKRPRKHRFKVTLEVEGELAQWLLEDAKYFERNHSQEVRFWLKRAYEQELVGKAGPGEKIGDPVSNETEGHSGGRGSGGQNSA